MSVSQREQKNLEIYTNINKNNRRFEFRSIPPDLISEKLKEICSEEKIEVEQPALDAISRMAMGGMRDAQSILDQMISFCGNTITQQNVLEVYGLVSSERISSLSNAIRQADYNSILRETDAFSTEGLDFYRALQDLSDHIRLKLVDNLNNSENNDYPEQMFRILDALREGEELVRVGLSEKTNFEVTLFRAVEAGKSRSIDQLIRNISKVIPQEEAKKKTVAKTDDPENIAPYEISEKSISINQSESVDIDISEKEDKQDPLPNPSATQFANNEDLLPRVQKNDGSDKEITVEKELRQIQDEGHINQMVERLPSELRKLLIDDYKVNFVSIEKIDPEQLI